MWLFGRFNYLYIGEHSFFCSLYFVLCEVLLFYLCCKRHIHLLSVKYTTLIKMKVTDLVNPIL